jgi:hypothetical protein
MKRFFLLLTGLAWAVTLTAQSGGAGQPSPAPAQKPAAAAPGTGSANPFPDDTSTVPVMSTAPTTLPAAESKSGYAASSAVSVAGDDADPVRSPDDPAPEAAAEAEGDSSSSKELDKILGPAGEDSADKDRKHRHEHETPQKQPTKKEVVAEDITVGSYYLDKKNWKAAQSRYQSAMVLDPENPEVYWGLAESAYHLGDLAEARDYYLKVADYDPDGPHGKQLKKILKDPALLNAKPRPPAPVPVPDTAKQ